MPSKPNANDRAPLNESETADLNAPSGVTGASSPIDPNDEIPVPIAMSAAEIDERAQVVEALRTGMPRRDDEVRPDA